MTGKTPDEVAGAEGIAADRVPVGIFPKGPETTVRVAEPSDVEPAAQQRTQVSEPKESPIVVAGSVTAMIGTGDNAKNSIAFLTIRWSFAFAALAWLVVVVHDFYTGTGQATADLKDVWALFSPIVTLGLGYLFGRQERG